jgi:ABC-type glycerol-3-phosphate transport system substrate-binding protein
LSRSKMSSAVLVVCLLCSILLPAASVRAEDKIVLTYWGWGGHVDAVNSVAGPAFEKLHPNVEVKGISMGPWDLMDKFYVSLVSGRGLPDVVQLVRRVSQNYMVPELLWDFTDFQKEYQGQLVESLQNDLLSADGRYLGIAPDYGPSVLYYNQQLVEELGIDVSTIKTWNDYLEIGKRISTQRPDLYVHVTYYPAGEWGSNYWRLFAQGAGANIYDENNKIIRDNVRAKEVTKLFYQLMTEVKTLKATVNDPSVYDAIRNNKLVFWPKNSYEAGQMRQQLPDFEGKWAAIPQPLMDEQGPNYTGNWGGVALVVPKQGKHAELAAEFAEFFATYGPAVESFWTEAYGVPAFKTIRDTSETINRQASFVDGLIDAITVREVGPWNFCNWAETEKLLGDTLDSMISGQRTPEEAWDWFEEQAVLKFEK